MDFQNTILKKSSRKKEERKKRIIKKQTNKQKTAYEMCVGDWSSDVCSSDLFSTVWNTQRFTELGREEKGEGGNRGDLVEKKESPNGGRAVKSVISLPSKNRY